MDHPADPGSERIDTPTGDGAHAIGVMDGPSTPRKERQQLLGYIESLTAALRNVEAENDALKEDLQKATRALDLSQAEVASLKTLDLQRESEREEELASERRLAEEQRVALAECRERVRVLEREAVAHERAASEQKDALQRLLTERDEISTRCARLQQQAAEAADAASSPSQGAQTPGKDSMKRNMQLSLQLEVAQKEARTAHAEMLKLRAQLQAVQDAADAGDASSDFPARKLVARTLRVAAPAPLEQDGETLLSDYEQSIMEQTERGESRRARASEWSLMDDSKQVQKMHELEKALEKAYGTVQDLRYTLASKTAEIEALKAVSSASNGQHRVAQQGQQTKVENVLDLYATSTENNELKGQVLGLQKALSEAKQKTKEQTETIENLRSEGEVQVEGLMHQIQTLERKLRAREYNTETDTAPASIVKKDFVLNMQELEPLMPKVMPVTRRPPHPLQHFESPMLSVAASDPKPVRQAPANGAQTRSPEQDMAQMRAELDALRLQQGRIQREMEAIQQTGTPSNAPVPTVLNGKLLVTIHSVQNVPKQDLFGGADPYCIIQVMDQTKKTQKKKKTTSPTYEETFEFPLQSVPTQQHVSITLMEWNAKWKGKHDKVGILEISLQDVAGRQNVDRQIAQFQSLQSGGLTGANQQPCNLLFSVRYTSDMAAPAIELSPSDQAAVASKSQDLARINQEIGDKEAQLAVFVGRTGVPSSGGDTLSGWQLRLCVIGAHHLPKMDMTGAADPYVTLDIIGQEQRRSKTIKNTLNPEWKEEFIFDIKDDKEELLLTVWDWDRMSKDEVIGEVRLRLADLSGKSSTARVEIMKRGTTKHVFGKHGDQSTITVSWAASNSMADTTGKRTDRSGAPDSADCSVPLTLSLKLDVPYDEAAKLQETNEEFKVALQKELALATGVEPDRFAVLNLHADSFIVDLNVLPDLDITSKHTPEFLVLSIMDQVASLPAGSFAATQHGKKIVACTLQNRKGQLEAENAFLVHQNGMLTAAISKIEKFNKLQSSERAARIMWRWTHRGQSMCFEAWKSIVAQKVLESELQESHARELDDINRELDGTKRQLDANNNQVKDQLELLKDAQDQARKAMEHAEREKAMAQDAAKELAEKHHELEMRLRKKMTDMKMQGGGPLLKVSVKSAQHLPKVDTFGWIDAFLQMTVGDFTQKTKIIKNEANPVWNEVHEFPVTDVGLYLRVLLYDWEPLGKSPRAIGELSVKLSDVMDQKSMDTTFVFKTAEGSVLQGGKNRDSSVVHLALSYEEESDVELDALQRELQEIKRKEQENEEAVAHAEAEIELAKEAFQVKPPFRIKVHVTALRNLPQMDSVLSGGKCDGYVIVECGRQRQQTNKVKNSFDPDFDDTFDFAVTKSSASLLLTVMDWNSSGNDVEVGHCQLPVGKLMPGTREHQLSLISPKTQDVVIGHDSKNKTLVTFSLTVETPAPSEPPPGAHVSGEATGRKSGPWKLKIALERAESLPKMDMFGKCDGYVIMSVNGERQTSKTIKNTYDPQWDEEFVFDITDDDDELIVKVMDWDLGCEDDHVGSVSVPLSDLRGREDGVQRVLNLKEKGNMVTGHDKNPTKIYIKFWAMKMAVFAAGGSADENANALNETGSEDPAYGTLTVFAKRADGLPRMDAWSGKADPYLTITVDGMTQKTKVKNRTLQPRWDEKFEFRCVANRSIVDVTCFDHETVSNDRAMGSFHIPVRNLSSYPTEIYALSGLVSTGHKASGNVHLQLSFAETAENALDAEDIEASGPGVWVKVTAANHLPKMDIFGKCDAKVAIEVDGQSCCTDVKKSCYDALYMEPPFNFAASGDDSTLLVTVYDHNLAKGDETVGSCSVDLHTICAGKNGTVSEDFNVLRPDGTPVIGHDKQPCTVSLSIKVNALPEDDVDAMSDDDAAEDVWDIDVTAMNFRSMPKMDTFGTCDAYLVFQLQGHEYHTEDVTGYQGEWNQDFHWDAIEGHNCNLLVKCYDKDKFDKDDFIGSCTIPLRKIIKKDFEKGFNLKDSSSQLVRGTDGKATTVYLRLRGQRSQRQISSLVAGINNDHHAEALEELCRSLYQKKWSIDVTVISADRMPSKCRPAVRLSVLDSASCMETCVHTSPKASGKLHAWNWGNNVELIGVDESKCLNLAIISKTSLSKTSVLLKGSFQKKTLAMGLVSCPIRDILLFYVSHVHADSVAEVRLPEVELVVMDAVSTVPMKDEDGFTTKMKLRFQPIFSTDVSESGWRDHSFRGPLLSAMGPNVRKMLQGLARDVEDYVASETKWQAWVSEVRDAEAGNLFKQLDLIEELDPLNAQVFSLREQLQSVRKEIFTTSQVEIFFGVLVTLVMMVVLKLLMLDFLGQ